MANSKDETPAVATFADHEVITPSNPLRKVVGPVVDPYDDPVARAEQALAQLSGEFAGWMHSECERLDTARKNVKRGGFNKKSHDELFRAAHDIRGEAATFGYPEVAGTADSLCRLVEHTPEQRGCGRSRPHASLDDNSTWDLIEDIERLRAHLGVESWTVFGGSWGSTLALAYAIKHPQRVAGLILRGVFLLTDRELNWFYQDGASLLFPDAWARFLAPIPAAERGDLMGAYHRRLTDPDRRIQAQAAAAWSQWEGDTLSLRGPQARPAKFSEMEFAIAFARIECHYFANKGFFPEDGWILKNIEAIRGIPGWIVQGRFDVVTPMESAWTLKQAWPEAQFEVIWDAGHASTEPGIIDALVRATDQAVR